MSQSTKEWEKDGVGKGLCSRPQWFFTCIRPDGVDWVAKWCHMSTDLLILAAGAICAVLLHGDVHVEGAEQPFPRAALTEVVHSARQDDYLRVVAVRLLSAIPCMPELCGSQGKVPYLEDTIVHWCSARDGM